MNRMQIPYRAVLIEPRDFDPVQTDDILRSLTAASREGPVVLEVYADDIQYLLFMNEGQLYWACAIDRDRARPLRIRDLLAGLRRAQFPRVVAYRADMVLYHSLLVYCQKKPELKVASTLVDLDELLGRVEQECANALISARDPDTLVLLRCQGSTTAASYHGASAERRGGAEAREDFLVTVYTISAKHPLEIDVFSDLAVTHAEDVRSLPADFGGSISGFYLSQPPRLVVRLKGRPLKTYSFAGAEMTIGRLPDNHIVIDNLSVSRKHAALAADGGGYALRDLGSKNGTLLNGAPVEKARLVDGDVIGVGKYEILFQMPAVDGAAADPLDQTVVMPRARALAARDDARAPACRPAPRLFRKSILDDYALEKDRTVIGRGPGADIRMGGLFAPRACAEIVRAGSEFVLRRAGRARVRVNGEETDEKTLAREDLITIGAEEFVFKE